MNEHISDTAKKRGENYIKILNDISVDNFNTYL